MLGQRYFGAETSVLCAHVARSDPTRWGRSRFLLRSPVIVVYHGLALLQSLELAPFHPLLVHERAGGHTHKSDVLPTRNVRKSTQTKTHSLLV